MKKNERKDNALIKHTCLAKEIRRIGIKRVNKDALDCLQGIFQEGMLSRIEELSRFLIVKGKKTLEKGDIKEFMKKLEERKEEGWEI